MQRQRGGGASESVPGGGAWRANERCGSGRAGFRGRDSGGLPKHGGLSGWDHAHGGGLVINGLGQARIGRWCDGRMGTEA